MWHLVINTRDTLQFPCTCNRYNEHKNELSASRRRRCVKKPSSGGTRHLRLYWEHFFLQSWLPVRVKLSFTFKGFQTSRDAPKIQKTGTTCLIKTAGYIHFVPPRELCSLQLMEVTWAGSTDSSEMIGTMNGPMTTKQSPGTPPTRDSPLKEQDTESDAKCVNTLHLI